MAAKLQGITLTIGGDTSDLNSALKDTNKEIYNTQSELKQVEKLLKLDPKNTELLAQKQELLSKEIGTTTTKLDALKQAKKQADESGLKGTEQGEKAYRELQREIAATESKLKSMKNEQDGLTQKFDLLGEKATTLNKAMAGLGLGVLGVGAGLVKAGLDTASYADEINTLAAQTGLTTDQIQKFQFASETIDVPLETLTGSMAKLTKNMSTAQKGSGDASKAFEALGISITDSNGELRSNQDVFNETIKALSDIENETQRDAYAMNIFGKSAQDLNPLIKGGAEKLEELGQKAEEMGLILSQDALDSANDLQDGIDELKAVWSKATQEIGANMDEYLKPVIDALKNMLEWVLDNKATVISALSGIAAGIMAFNMVSMIQGMISAFKAWQVATEGMTFAQKMLNLVMAANPLALIVTLITAVVTALIVLWNTNEDFRNALINAWNKIKETADKVWNAIAKFFIEDIPNAFNSVIDFLKNNWQEILLFITNPIAGAIKLLYNLNPKFREWVDGLLAKLKEWFGKMKDVGKYIVEGLWNGIVNMKDWLLNKIKSFASTITDGIKAFFGIESPSKVMRDEVGTYLAQGIGVGFEREIPSVIDDIVNSVSSVSDMLQTELDMNAVPNINKSVTAQNFYTTKSYQNTTEVVRQPSEVTLVVDKTALGRVVVPAYNAQSKILGVSLS